MQVIKKFEGETDTIYDSESDYEIKMYDYLEAVVDVPKERLPRLRSVIKNLKVSKMLTHAMKSSMKDIAGTSAEGIGNFYDAILIEFEKNMFQSRSQFSYEVNINNIKKLTERVINSEVKILL